MRITSRTPASSSMADAVAVARECPTSRTAGTLARLDLAAAGGARSAWYPQPGRRGASAGGGRLVLAGLRRGRRLLASAAGPVLDLGSDRTPGRGAQPSWASPRWCRRVAQAVTGPAAEVRPPWSGRVFDALPGEGRWPTVLLFDGNVGHRWRSDRPAGPPAMRPRPDSSAAPRSASGSPGPGSGLTASTTWPGRAGAGRVAGGRRPLVRGAGPTDRGSCRPSGSPGSWSDDDHPRGRRRRSSGSAW